MRRDLGKELEDWDLKSSVRTGRVRRWTKPKDEA